MPKFQLCPTTNEEHCFVSICPIMDGGFKTIGLMSWLKYSRYNFCSEKKTLAIDSLYRLLSPIVSVLKVLLPYFLIVINYLMLT